MFPPGKSDQEIWGFKIFRFPGSLCRDPGKCLYISKDFRGTDIYHSDIKNALVLRYCKLKIFFAYKKLFFKIHKIFYDEMLARLQIFLQFVEKMVKLKL